MPAIRSSKGNSPDDSDNKKGKVPYAGRKNNKKNNILPCDVCGFVASRKADMTRHAKTHSPDSQKLPCSWEGCDYSTLQRSNLETHYRRHTKDKSNTCYDDPKCDFSTCDPASLLRHRKRSHGYIPGRRRKNKKNKKRVPVCVIRGAEPDASGSSSIASQFNTFSSAGASTSSSSRPFSGPGEASTSGSSSSRPFAEPSTSRSSSSRPFSAVVSSSGSFSSRPFLLPQPPSVSPSAFPAASGLLRHQSQFPLSLQPSVTSSIAPYRTSQPHRQSHPYMYYPTSYSSVESEVTVSPFTPATSTFPCDFSQGGQYNSTSYGRNPMLLSPFPPWAGVNMAGTDGFSLAGQQQHSLAGQQQQLSSFPMTTQHPIHISSHHQTNFESPIEGLYGDASRYHPQYYITPLDRDVAAASATSQDMMNVTDLNTNNQLNQNYYRFYRGDWWME